MNPIYNDGPQVLVYGQSLHGIQTAASFYFIMNLESDMMSKIIIILLFVISQLVFMYSKSIDLNAIVSIFVICCKIDLLFLNYEDNQSPFKVLSILSKQKIYESVSVKSLNSSRETQRYIDLVNLHENNS